MTAQYLPVLLAVIGSAGFMAVMLLINAILGPKPNLGASPASKREPFECGSPPLQANNKQRVSVKFYLVALLFVMFDLEAVLLDPWAVVSRGLGLFGFMEVLGFMVSLVVGLGYGWREGALEWT